MTEFQADRTFALTMDQNDPLAQYRHEFFIPKQASGEDVIYFCGNSLGLQPKSTRAYVEQELKDWQELGVEGHFQAKRPWMPYHEFLREQTAQIVGALPAEVVVMNTLTVNLHLMMVSFYRPSPQRHKILIEANAFPSDRYAVQSQLRFHGYDPKEALLELPLRPEEATHRSEDILQFIDREGDAIALIMLGGVNYYSGQAFDMATITCAGHDRGCTVGFDLAHAAGNLILNLHDWQVDFAVWCNYKYMNGGPGCIGGCFVHERHGRCEDIPRFSGWWGHDQATRFAMPAAFRPTTGADGWQLSNPPILAMAALKAALDIFQSATMQSLRQKSKQLTAYLAFLLNRLEGDQCRIITPSAPNERGCQLSLQMRRNGKAIHAHLQDAGVVCDWREPDVIRIAPVPLYNTFADVYDFVSLLQHIIEDSR